MLPKPLSLSTFYNEDHLFYELREEPYNQKTRLEKAKQGNY